jgi:phosphatidylinositol alpha-1,6-mannosyltransferase
VRILVLTSSFPPQLGGVETYLLELVHALDAHDVTLVVPEAGARAPDDHGLAVRVQSYRDRDTLSAWRAQTRLWRAGGLPARSPRLAMILALNRTLSRRTARQADALSRIEGSFDLIVGGTVFPSGLLGALRSAASGTPYTLIAHGAEILAWRSRPTHHALLREVVRGAASIGAVSAYTAGLVEAEGVARERIHRVDPGIDPGPFLDLAAPARERVRMLQQSLELEGRRVLVTHGRLDPRKGHDVVLRALPKILERHPRSLYLITGAGPSEASLRVLARELGVASNVRFAGAIVPADVPSVFECCEVMLMISRQIGTNVEGFGIVCLEAAAAGKPVVAGRSGGVPSAVADGETGILVDPESPAEVAEAVGSLLDDPARAKAMGVAGRRRVLESFDRRAFRERITRWIDASVAMHG